jgi:hypothetical protein
VLAPFVSSWGLCFVEGPLLKPSTLLYRLLPELALKITFCPLMNGGVSRFTEWRQNSKLGK